MTNTYKVVQYRRWDNRVFELQLISCDDENSDNVIYKVSSAKRIKVLYKETKLIPGFEKLSIPEMRNTRVIRYQLSNSELLYLDADSFYEKVEYGEKNVIMVESVVEYINIIQAYHFISFAIKIYYTFEDCDNSDPQKRKYWQVSMDEIIKSIEKATTLMKRMKGNPARLQTEISKAEVNLTDYLKRVCEDKQTRSEENPYQSELLYQTARRVNHLIHLYEQGDNFAYYRGVGRVIYPEQPSVFRGERKYEEDRLYRLMKTTFPEEMGKLRYLDRLALLQHYGLPTRMLDVSANPLVALYMVCNTVYTGDKSRVDDGEVILYFTGSTKERTYDSKALLIVASLVKLTYEEKTNMYKFIRLHQVYCPRFIDQKKGINEYYTAWELLNRCVHSACEHGGDSIVSPSERILFEKMLAKLGIKMNMNIESYADFCWACMKGIKRPKDDTNWRCINVKASQCFNEIIDEKTYRNLFSAFVDSYDRLLVTVRRENPAFQNKIDIASLLDSYHGQFGMSNDRILAQAGSFIIAGLDHRYINDVMISTRRKDMPFQLLRIIIKNKRAMDAQLRLLNINDSTMMPDMSHKANYLCGQVGG